MRAAQAENRGLRVISVEYDAEFYARSVKAFRLAPRML